MSLGIFEYLPRGDAGWSSGLLDFGRNTTVLLGANGTGKTPLIKGIAYCLGYPIELPPDVRDKCSAARLTIVASDGPHTIVRQLVTGLDVMVTDSAGKSEIFNDERRFSAWLLPKLGVPLRSLMGKRDEKVAAYVSVVGPMFLVAQDAGWLTGYVPLATHQFVKDQQEEIARWLLNIPAKNRVVDKSEFQAAKANHAAIQEQIAFKRKGLEALQREIGEDRADGASRRLEQRKAALEQDLLRAHSILENASHTESALDVRLREMVGRRDEIAFKLSNVKRRKAQLVEVQAEVGGELGALEQNEIAAEAFRGLCGNTACQFFRRPEESYGRRVLYLKDQLKDFDSSASATERELAVLHEQLVTAEAGVADAIALKKASLEGSEAGVALAIAQAMSRDLADVRARLDRLERLAQSRQQFEELVTQEASASDEVAQLRPSRGSGRDNARLLDARQILAATFKEWLLALRTPNVPANVVFDEELRLIVSGEHFSSTSSHSGSTRTRLVLAHHAAFLETSLLMGGVHPRFLILDAPRQHELTASDLRSFIERFYAMSARQKQPVQLVFSATDPAVLPEGRVDRLWEPTFETGGELRFLGPIQDRGRNRA